MRKPTYFSDEYTVDELGNVYGKSGRKLKPSLNPRGYQIINYMKDGRQYGAAVHRVVAIAFIDNPHRKPQVNHIDGDKTNNTVSNLEWVTELENVRHAIEVLGFDPRHRQKMAAVVGRSATDKNEVCRFDSIREAGRWIDNKYNVKSGASEVHRAIHRRRKTARGYYWDYDVAT